VAATPAGHRLPSGAPLAQTIDKITLSSLQASASVPVTAASVTALA